MHTTLSGVYQQRGDWYIGYVEELPGANVQEHTLDQARESLKEADTLIIESNRALGREELYGESMIQNELFLL